MDPIGRRYFVMNAFDGVMTALGIVLGGGLAIAEPLKLFKAGFGASLAIMVSGFWGAFMAERAERKAEIKEMERHLLRSLKGSRIEEEAKKKMLELALIDALSPFLGSLLPLLPFLAAHFNLIPFMVAYFSSIALSFLVLIFLGAYLAKITGENPLITGLIFASGGFVIGLLTIALEKMW